ncbi:MAG TPA: hypothetical protein EYN31_03375 [Candidatus Marinimicrobia bacterium]|nr:hypothetical protein [Candidatus Neomarinimicrobiota bacterium]
MGEDNQRIEDIHLVLIGFGQTGQAIAEEVMFTGHYAGGMKPRLTVVDKEMDVLQKKSGTATKPWIRS